MRADGAITRAAGDPAGAGSGGGDLARQGDAALLADSVSDPELFAVVFRRHAPAVLRYVTRRIGAQAADDVVAETFLVAFRQRDSFRPDGRDCLPWLYGIATNLLGRHRRREIQQLRLLARTGVDPVVESFTDQVDEAVTARRARARLGAALVGLPASQRDALLLLAWAGLRYEEVATATGAPLGTVQSRISRARTRLRQELADLDPAFADADRPSPTISQPPERGEQQ
jgi:RNA polymerase sigma-70 factor (ECF subfamily)